MEHTTDQHPSNVELAEILDRVSVLLTTQGAQRFRADAYHRAAETIRRLPTEVWRVYESSGVEGLESLEQIGPTISRALQHLIRGERWPLLARLEGDDAVEHAFASIPNIGPKLAERIHEQLGIETLAELQAAAWDGRLAGVAGFGDKRLRAVRESLAARGRSQPQQLEKEAPSLFDRHDDLSDKIPVAELLDIDHEYRYRVSKGDLPRVAPRRFNPSAEPWLPILHTVRGDRHYTALFSNTGHAHALGTTRDWVVIYLESHTRSGGHGRWTVITSRLGSLRGRRIVRGRERDCQEYYDQRAA